MIFLFVLSPPERTMNVSKLTLQNLELLTKIHQIMIPKRTKKFSTKAIYSESHPTPHPYTQAILDMVFQCFRENHIDNTRYEAKKYLIEFHQRNSGFEKKPHKTFDWHKDDFAATSWPVQTCIFYLRKDNTIDGGNLEYKIGGEKYTHKVETGDLLQFQGDISHKPQSTSGFGCRDIIVVFVKRND